MEEKKNPLKNVKIVIRPSSPALKIAVILLIVFSMAALVALRWVHNGILNQTQELRDEAAEVQQENDELEGKLEDPDSVDSIEGIAEDELGLVRPDTIIIETE